MDTLDLLLKYWPVWTTIVSLILVVIVWNFNMEKRVSLMEGRCMLAKEITDKRETAVDKAIDKLFDLMRDVEKVVNEIKGLTSAKKEVS